MQSRSRAPMLGKNCNTASCLDDSRTRFQIELEFVQCLGNPSYLNFLAQEGHLENPALVNYLHYLRYWREPAYSKFLIYPYCLHMLELLQHPEFRAQLARGQVCRYIDDQLLLHWQHYLRKRASLIAKHVEEIATIPDVKSTNQPSATATSGAADT